MKKIFLSLVLVVVFLSSCKSEVTTPVVTTEAKVETQKMKKYTSLSGEVELPINPKRIVSDFYIGEFIPLGIKPVGVNKSHYSSENPLWSDFLKDVENTEGSVEKTLSLDPDLIITMDKEKYEKYKLIAPTVLIPYGSYEVRDLMIELGEITSTEDKANSWIASYDGKIAIAKETIKPHLKDDSTFSTMEIWDNKIFIYGDNFGRGGMILYDELGLKAPEKAQNEIIGKTDSYAEIGAEALPQYLGNNVFFVASVDSKKTTTEELSVWSNLEAYKNNKIYRLDSAIYYNSDPVSLEYQLDEIVKFIVNGNV